MIKEIEKKIEISISVCGKIRTYKCLAQGAMRYDDNGKLLETSIDDIVTGKNWPHAISLLSGDTLRVDPFDLLTDDQIEAIQQMLSS